MSKELMISSSLAARERPKTFKDMVGQKHIISQLKGCIASKKLPGTILFYGPPGTGKTTLARVFARYLNCDTFDACGECSSCLMDMDSHPDITEVNMADTSGKEDAKGLLQKARYSPRFRVRVLILDEFQQATAHAEQCLLKSFEEPPKNTIWILCTTNPEKFKPATLTRCLKLQVKIAGTDELSEKLIKIAKKEGLDLSDKKGKELTMTIANYANGQVRDAISLLESVILAKAGNKKVDLEEVIDQFASSLESTIDKAAVRCTIAFIRRGVKGICSQASIVDSCRQLLMKMRWICMSVIDDYSGNLKFKSYAFQDFLKSLKTADIRYDFSVLVPDMLQLLKILNTIEQTMNQTNADERALFTSELCHFVMQQKKNK